MLLISGDIRFVSKRCYEPKRSYKAGNGEILPRPKSFRHGVVCCNNQICKSRLYDPKMDNHICLERKTYDEAKQICQANNMRLCSNDELTNKRFCCEASCRDFDKLWVWVNDMRKKSLFAMLIVHDNPS